MKVLVLKLGSNSVENDDVETYPDEQLNELLRDDGLPRQLRIEWTQCHTCRGHLILTGDYLPLIRVRGIDSTEGAMKRVLRWVEMKLISADAAVRIVRKFLGKTRLSRRGTKPPAPMVPAPNMPKSRDLN